MVITVDAKILEFNAQEQAAINAYEGQEATAVRDCFDAFGLDSIQSYEAEFGTVQCRVMLKEHAGLLQEWFYLVDRLLSDALLCSTESTSYGRAASEYISVQVDAFHRARQGFEYAVTAWTLGLDTTPLGNYPPPTRGLSLPMQSLTTE
jgi:hypothetical protein